MQILIYQPLNNTLEESDMAIGHFSRKETRKALELFDEGDGENVPKGKTRRTKGLKVKNPTISAEDLQNLTPVPGDQPTEVVVKKRKDKNTPPVIKQEHQPTIPDIPSERVEPAEKVEERVSKKPVETEEEKMASVKPIAERPIEPTDENPMENTPETKETSEVQREPDQPEKAIHAVEKLDASETGVHMETTPESSVRTVQPEFEHPAKMTQSSYRTLILIFCVLAAVTIVAGVVYFYQKSTLTPKPVALAVDQPKPAPQNPVPALSEAVYEPADGKVMAEMLLGKTLPWPPEVYSSHKGEDGYPDTCAGLCWDTSKLAEGIMVWYGPNKAEEDITQSDAKFGNGTMGPLDLMRTGKMTKVIFANAIDAQLEVCAIGTLDGQPLTKILGVNDGECGKRVALSAGWHVIEDNANLPIAGFGVRYTASGWSGMSESKIVEYTKYWKIDGGTATWIGPEGIEIMMTPSMVQMMQDFAVLKNVVFTTNKDGNVLFCNGTVSGSATLSSPDGACHLYEVKAGAFTYTGEPRLSAGISWQPK